MTPIFQINLTTYYFGKQCEKVQLRKRKGGFINDTSIHFQSELEVVNEGYHSYTTKEEAIRRTFDKRIAVQCIIPKGTRYYCNPDDKEYVSETIIIQKKLR